MNAIDYVREAKQLGVVVDNDSGELVLRYPGEKTVRISHPSRHKEATHVLRALVQRVRVRQRAGATPAPQSPPETNVEAYGVIETQARRIDELSREVEYLLGEASRLERQNEALKESAGILLSLLSAMVGGSGWTRTSVSSV